MDVSKLYPHQIEAIKKAGECLDIGIQRINIALPPGSGKSTVVIAVIDKFLQANAGTKHVLLITRTVAEKQQLAEKFERIDITFSINFDVRSTAFLAKVAIFTLAQTSRSELRDSLRKLRVKFDMIVFLGGSLTNPTLEAIFQEYTDSTQFIITDLPESNLRFGEPVMVYSLKEGIADAILYKPYKVKHLKILPQSLLADFSELSEEKMKSLLRDSVEILQDSAKQLLAKIGDDKTLVYCPNITFAQQFAKVINDEVGNSAHAAAITSLMPFHVQRDTYHSYRNNPGEPSVLCLVSATIQGSDLSLTRSIAIFRNTNSLGLLQNMILPGLRPYKDKKELQVLDFVGLEILFSQLGSNKIIVERGARAEVTEEMPLAHEYFNKSNISFRDKREIEGVLGVDDLSEELAEIIGLMPPEQGSMIGIFGKWGRGKTFLMEQTWLRLEKKKKFIRVEFHAWKYQDTPATWAYLYECLSDAYVKPDFKWKELRTWPERIKKLALLNFERKGCMPILKFSAILSAGVFIFLLGKNLITHLDVALGSAFGYFGFALTSTATIYALLKSISKEYSSKARDLFLKYSTKHSFKEHLGLQAEIQKETLALLKVWIPEEKLQHQKVVLFVEDIDRCSESKIIQIIDSLRVLLEDKEIAKRVVVVAAVDERMLKLAIKMKYHSLIALNEKDDLQHAKTLGKVTNEYIDKLFIAGLKLGELSATDSDDFLVALTKPDREQVLVSSLQDLLNKEATELKSRNSQQLRDQQLDHEIEQRQNMDGMLDYEDPDYAIEYLNNSVAISESLNQVSNIQNSRFIPTTLSNDEIDVLRISINKLQGATPRQIRIFYYRYLIAKNLLIRRYRTLRRTNVWQRKLNSRILSNLIVLYTLHEEEGILDKHLQAALKSNKDNQYVELLHETMVSGFDYRELLKVLSVVIAY